MLHTCDNPICCNPFHLFLGTNQTNLVDSIIKRRRRGLTPQQRSEIRARLRSGDGISALARDFDVTTGAIAYHARRLHLPDLDPEGAEAQ